MKNRSLILGLSLLITLMTASRSDIQPTSVEIQHPVRHYYPIPSGEDLNIVYNLRNTGKYPLVISEIQTSCGCITHTPDRYIVPPKETRELKFTYHSEMNEGLVTHQIRLFGNFENNSMHLLEFDVNVIPPSDFPKDYEETNKHSNTVITPGRHNNYWY